jgi:hypothetical protein
MTPADFLEALESELRLRCLAFDRRAVQEFVEAAWPLMAEDLDPGLWAREFVARGKATLTT